MIGDKLVSILEAWPNDDSEVWLNKSNVKMGSDLDIVA